MAVENLNGGNFDSIVIGANKPVFVDFNAAWCGPCRVYGPAFHAFAEKHAAEAVFGSVDIDDNRELAMRFGIQAVPTTLIFKGGEIVDSITGAAGESVLAEKLARLL